MTFQQIILTLQKFWSARGCILEQPYDVEKGAGTMNPATFSQNHRAGAVECGVCGTVPPSG